MCPVTIIWCQKFLKVTLSNLSQLFFLKIFRQTLFLEVDSRLLAPIINHPLASINTDVHSIDTDGKSLKLQIQRIAPQSLHVAPTFHVF